MTTYIILGGDVCKMSSSYKMNSCTALMHKNIMMWSYVGISVSVAPLAVTLQLYIMFNYLSHTSKWRHVEKMQLKKIFWFFFGYWDFTNLTRGFLKWNSSKYNQPHIFHFNLNIWCSTLLFHLFCLISSMFKLVSFIQFFWDISVRILR